MIKSAVIVVLVVLAGLTSAAAIHNRYDVKECVR